MKKLLLFLPLIGFALSTSAQVVSSCQTSFIDTVKYVDQVKTSGYSLLSVKYENDAPNSAGGYCAYAQLFEAPDTVKVMGFCFGGFINSGSSDTIVCRLYKESGGAPGMQIDSVIYSVPLVAGYSGPYDSDLIRNCVSFGSGHILEGNYIITVENFSSSDLFLVKNIDGEGAGEDLSFGYYALLPDPTWDGWYRNFSSWGVEEWDFDLNFEPIIEYSLYSELTISADSICGSDALIVFDTIVSFDDSILYNKMYNPNFASYTGYNTSVNYVYGDGNSDDLGNHIYTAGGDYSVLISDTILATGWTNDYFLSSCNSLLHVFPIPDLGLDTTLCMQSSLILSPGVFNMYSWNTGQLTDSIIVGPILNPGVITYAVDVTSALCNSTASITITFDNCIGIEEINNHSLHMYPNPG